MRKLIIKFVNTENLLNAPKCGCPLKMVAEACAVSPGKWTRKASAELGISQRSVQRMLKKLKLKPYRPSLLQALHEDDTGRQLEFCETILYPCGSRSKPFVD